VREPRELEARVRELERRLAALESRLAEGGADAARESAVATPSEETGPLAPAGLGRLQSVPALAGRTFLVLGGAFLFRSLTESGTLSTPVGVALGIAYALVWLFLADRAAVREQVLGGAFHAFASAIIVYPLLFEATTRFALLGPWLSAALVLAANLAGLFIAWRRDFRALAWIHQSAALAVLVPLLFRVRRPEPYVALLLALALASLILAYGRGWRGQRWLVALAADGIVAFLAMLLVIPREAPAWLGAGAVATAQVGLLVLYLGAFVYRLLIQERSVTPFAVTQTVLALLVGFEGALLVGTPEIRRILAFGALAAGLLIHGGLARRSESRFGHGATVGYFSTVATFLAAEGTRLLLPGAVAGSIWLVAAVALGTIAIGGDRPYLQLHAALLSVAGAAVAGVVTVAAVSWLRTPAVEWPPLSPVHVLVIALGVVTAALLFRGVSKEGPDRLARTSRILALAIALYGLGGAATHVAGRALAPSAGGVAVVRTLILALSAGCLAAAAPRLERSELGRFAWLLLALGGAKLALEDLRVGGAGHLVLSFALYGAALIAVPALLRRRRGPVEGGDSA